MNTPRTKTDAMIAPPVPGKITLPAAPFDIPPATHDETAPRCLPVRGKPSAEANRQLRSFARYDMRVVKTGTVSPDAVRDTLQWVKL